MGGFLVGVGKRNWSFCVCFAGTLGSIENPGKVSFAGVGISNVCFGVTNGAVEIRTDYFWLIAGVHGREGGARIVWGGRFFDSR